MVDHLSRVGRLLAQTIDQVGQLQTCEKACEIQNMANRGEPGQCIVAHTFPSLAIIVAQTFRMFEN